MTKATELIKGHYYVIIPKVDFNGTLLKHDIWDPFQSMESIPDISIMIWETPVKVGVAKKTKISYGMKLAFIEKRIFEISDDEFIMRNIK